MIVITGDGDCLAIGGNHLIHACRRNLDITCLMLNNEVYGMTGGQVSPTTSANRLTTTTPGGNCEPTFDACKFAEAGASFVGREVTRQAGAEEPDPQRNRARRLFLRRGHVGLHGNLRPQERSRRIAGNDPRAEGRHAAGSLRQRRRPAVPPNRLVTGVHWRSRSAPNMARPIANAPRSSARRRDADMQRTEIRLAGSAAGA